MEFKSENVFMVIYFYFKYFFFFIFLFYCIFYRIL